MKAWAKVLIVAALILAVAAVVVSKQRARSGTPGAGAASGVQSGGQQGPAEAVASTDSKAAAPLPRLVDLGSTTCIPCQMMVPVLKALKEEQAGRLDVEFIDVMENPAAQEKYGIQVIPTQIFIDAQGKELRRHEGFFSKDDIVAQWKELGVDLAAPEGQ